MNAALRAAALVAALAAVCGAQAVDPYLRATDLEQRGDLRGAAASYRQAIRGPNAETALLDYERVCADVGCTDAVITLVDSLVRARPSWTLARSVQLRALRMAGRAPEARQAFERWTAAEPRSVVPFREYSRLLIQGGSTAEADSVLRRGRSMGGARDLAYEVAQQRAASGQWVPSAEAWREALDAQPYLAQAALFALRNTPAASRDDVRRALLLAPAPAGARGAAAALLLAWGSPADAWSVLSALPPNDSATVAAWRDFGERAEEAGAWSAGRDAFAAASRATRSGSDAARAATDALAAGDAAGALTIARALHAGPDSVAALRLVAMTEVRALAILGRAEEAERLAVAAGARMPEQQQPLAREAALGWVRRGDVPRARAAVARAGGDDEVNGLLALYDGDLAAARPLLRHPSTTSGDVVLAVAVLGRTAAARASGLGDAFLRLARGDSVGAAAAFERATGEVGDAAPALLLEAARLHAGSGDRAGAIRDWQRILAEHGTSAEAPEADLTWGQALARAGDTAAASARFEHLLVTFPESALAPQARAARAALGGS